MLEAMEAFDLRVRAELVRTGQLFEGYDPRMQRVHLANARRLERMLEDGPWPTREIVGQDGARAAWLIVQHALPAPSLMRRALPFIREAAKVDEASAVRAAMLEDRIATLEGRPQRWGTQFDWDETGRLVPQPLEDPAGVDARRLEIGLPPLAEQTERHQAAAAAEGQQPPSDPVSRRAAMETWLGKVGWRT
jgi:hypothetical protein